MAPLCRSKNPYLSPHPTWILGNYNLHEGLYQWGRRLEGWPNTAACLAYWRRVTRQVWFCTWWTGRTACLFHTVPVALTGAAQLRANAISSWCYELRHASKAWHGTLVNPYAFSLGFTLLCASSHLLNKTSHETYPSFISLLMLGYSPLLKSSPLTLFFIPSPLLFLTCVPQLFFLVPSFLAVLYPLSLHSIYDVAFPIPHSKVLKSQRQDKTMTKMSSKCLSIHTTFAASDF